MIISERNRSDNDITHRKKEKINDKSGETRKARESCIFPSRRIRGSQSTPNLEGYNMQHFTFTIRASMGQRARLHARASPMLGWTHHSQQKTGHKASYCLFSSLKPASCQSWEAVSNKQVEKSSQPTASHLFNPEGGLSLQMPSSSQQIFWFQYWFYKYCPERLPGNRPKLHEIYLHSSTVIENPSCIIQKRAKDDSEKVSLHVLWGCLTPLFLSLSKLWTNHS